MATYDGSCLCGGSRVEVRGPEVKAQDRCHCLDCQRTSGSAFATSITVNQSDADITGDQVGRYTYTLASGNENVRIFCRGCGCALGQLTPKMPGKIAIQTGALGKYASKIPFKGGEEIFVKDRWSGVEQVEGANQRQTM